MQICVNHGLLGLSESLTATPFRDCNSQIVHQIWCEKTSFFPRGLTVKPLLPMIGPEKSNIDFNQECYFSIFYGVIQAFFWAIYLGLLQENLKDIWLQSSLLLLLEQVASNSLSHLAFFSHGISKTTMKSFTLIVIL